MQSSRGLHVSHHCVRCFVGGRVVGGFLRACAHAYACLRMRVYVCVYIYVYMYAVKLLSGPSSGCCH